MTQASSRAHFFSFRRSLPVSFRMLCLTLCSLCLCGQSFLFVPTAHAQSLDKPLQTIDEDITAFAFAPDSRIVYSVNRNLKTKLYDLEHDDIWIQDSGGKRRRLLEGQKFNRGNQPFSYIVDSFRWSSNGRMILAQFFTTTVLDDSGKTQDTFQTLVLEDSGKEIRIGKGDSLIPDATDSFWLPDNVTIGYLSETVKPRQLFSMKFARLAIGLLPSFYEGRTFRDLILVPGVNAAIAIEQDHSQTGPSRLQRLDLLSDDDQELATLGGYGGGLCVSPRGNKVAYFIDKEILEVRDLSVPDHLARLRVGLGVIRWSPDESRILLKRAIEKKSGDLVWIEVPPLNSSSKDREIPILQPPLVPILHGLTFRDFAISPDGRFLAVVAPGKRNLQVFPLPR